MATTPFRYGAKKNPSITTVVLMGDEGKQNRTAMNQFSCGTCLCRLARAVHLRSCKHCTCVVPLLALASSNKRRLLVTRAVANIYMYANCGTKRRVDRRALCRSKCMQRARSLRAACWSGSPWFVQLANLVALFYSTSFILFSCV